ncbi:hypothetical protein [Streptomyces sp. NPDC093097]|uniref:hypothetical protein n=1 Tax=Streptomyces sp. NPDC093097 TaxID=3366027 RepID=UPI003805EE4F
MTYRCAVIPAAAGGLLLTALLWWAGASAHALQLPGTANVVDIPTATEFMSWLTPWSYDPPFALQPGGDVPSDGQVFGGAGDAALADSAHYLSLYTTGMQVRFGAVFVFFVLGALLLVRRMPPVRGRTPATLLAVWAWGLVAGTLAVTVSAPWLLASQGHASFRLLPHLASVVASGRQVLVGASLAAAAATVFIARIAAKGTDPLPQNAVPARAARLAATVGTAVVAFSVVVLSYLPVAAALQTVSPRMGLISEPGDLLRQWLLLGGWAGPAGTPLVDWLLYRATDVLLLAVVWWALRRLPGLLTRATVPAMAVGSVCATVLGLLASQLLRMVLDWASPGGGLLRSFAGFGEAVPAALTCGLAAGVAAAVTLRSVAGRTAPTGTAPADQQPAQP